MQHCFTMMRYAEAMSTDTITLGQQIRQARESKGLSMGALARKIGVHPSTILGWERGRHRPEAPSLQQAARALGTSPDDWLILAGYRDEQNRWESPRKPIKPDDQPPPIALLSRTSVLDNLPGDPLELGKQLLEQAPEQIVVAVYALLAGAADDKRALWQRRIQAAWTASDRLFRAALIPEDATPEDVQEIRFTFFWQRLFGGAPPPDG
jgi:transcriptional regulator with XRE-family HTH domain